MRARLLVNLGSPRSPKVADVRRYLDEFLMDPLVIDIPWPLRWALLQAIILPFRSPKSAEAYQSIWMPEGSPLLVYTQQLVDALNVRSAEPVAMAMRYGEPSVASVLDRLAAQADEIAVLPLYPQYAESSTLTVYRACEQWRKSRRWKGRLVFEGHFYDQEFYLKGLADQIDAHLKEFSADALVFSYHGLPLRHIRRVCQHQRHCGQNICQPQDLAANPLCYRAQSYATTRGALERLSSRPPQVITSFQSRLGRSEWTGPSTESLMVSLPASGVKNLAIISPSFVVDCLETLEEVAIRFRQSFLEAGGESFRYIPCLNGKWGELWPRH